MNRLDTIAIRQRKGLVRDVVFAALVVIAGAISITSVTTAVRGATVIAHR